MYLRPGCGESGGVGEPIQDGVLVIVCVVAAGSGGRPCNPLQACSDSWLCYKQEFNKPSNINNLGDLLLAFEC